MTDRDERPDPDALLRRVQAEEAAPRPGRASRSSSATRPGVGKTYTMLESARRLKAAGRRRRRWAASRRTAAPRPRRCSRGWRSCPGARSHYRGDPLAEFDLDARPRAQARGPAPRRAGPHERAGQPPPQALAGRPGAARRRHRRPHDAQRPARREPERRRRADHRRAGARDRPGLDPRARRRDRAGRPAARTSCSCGCARARSTSRSRRRGRPSTSSGAATCSRCASSPCGAPPSGGRRRARLPAGRTTSRRPGRRRSASWSASGRARPRRSSSAGRGAWPRASRAPWVAVYADAPDALPDDAGGPGAARGAPAARRVARRRGRPADRAAGSARSSSATPASTTSPASCVGKPTHSRWRDVFTGSLVERTGARQRRHRGALHRRASRGPRPGPDGARSSRRPLDWPGAARRGAARARRDRARGCWDAASCPCPTS